MPIDWKELFDTSKLDDERIIPELQYGEALGIEQKLKPTAKGAIEYELEVLGNTRVGQALFEYMKENNIKLEFEETSRGSHIQGNVIRIDLEQLKGVNSTLLSVIAHEIAHAVGLDDEKNPNLVEATLERVKKELESLPNNKEVNEIMEKSVEPIIKKGEELQKKYKKIETDIVAIIESQDENVKYESKPDILINKQLNNIAGNIRQGISADYTIEVLSELVEKNQGSISPELLNISEQVMQKGKEMDTINDKTVPLFNEFLMKMYETGQALQARPDLKFDEYIDASSEYHNLKREKGYLIEEANEEYSIDIEMMISHELGLGTYIRNHYHDGDFSRARDLFRMNKDNDFDYIPTSENFTTLYSGAVNNKEMSSTGEAWKQSFNEFPTTIHMPEYTDMVAELIDVGIISKAGGASNEFEKIIHEDKLLKYSYDLITKATSDGLINSEEHQKIKELGTVLERVGIDLDMNISEDSKSNSISVGGYFRTIKEFDVDKDLIKK